MNPDETEPADAPPPPPPPPPPAPPPPPPAPPAAPFKLLRSRSDRKLGGIAGGLAAASGLDSTIVRLALAAACVTGWGLLVYVLAWVIIPSEDPDAGITVTPAPADTARLIRIGLAVAAGIGVLQLVGGLFGLLFSGVGVLFDPFGARHYGVFHPWRPFVGFLLLLGGGIVLFRRRRTGEWPSNPFRSPAPTSTGPVPAGPTQTALALPGTTVPGPTAAPGSTTPPGPTTPPRPTTPPVARPAGPRRDVPLLIGRAAGWLVVLWFLLAAAVATGLWVVGAVTIHWPVVPLAAGAGALGLLGWTLIRSRRLAVLAGAAATLAVPILLAGILGRFDGSAGYRSVAPSSPAELERSYHQATGQLDLNLEHLKLDPGTTQVTIDMGAGGVNVTVPWDTEVQAAATVGVGRFELFGREQSGFGLAGHVRSAGEPGAPRLELKTHAGAGAISVYRASPSPTRQALAMGAPIPLRCEDSGSGIITCSSIDNYATPDLTCIVSAGLDALCRPTGLPEPRAPWSGQPGTRRCTVPPGGGPATCSEPLPTLPAAAGGTTFTCTIPPGGGTAECHPPSSSPPPPGQPAAPPAPPAPPGSGTYVCTVPPEGGAATCRPA